MANNRVRNFKTPETYFYDAKCYRENRVIYFSLIALAQKPAPK